MLISCFRNVKDVNPVGNMEFAVLLNKIKTNSWSNYVDKFRLLDKDTQDKKKPQLPCFTICGTFSQRRADCLLEYSSMICIDVDDIPKDKLSEMRTKIEQDIYTHACFLSVSGTGFAVVIKIDATPESHATYYDLISKYYKSKFGISCDSQCKDVSRLRFITGDSDSYYKESSAVFSSVNGELTEEAKAALLNAGINERIQGDLELKTLEAQKEKELDAAIPGNLSAIHDQAKQIYNSQLGAVTDKYNKYQKQYSSVYNDTDIEAIVEEVASSSKVLGDDSYDSWFRLAMSLYNEMGEAGRSLFHKISSTSRKYSPEDCDKKFNHCAKSSNGDITIGTFLYHAKHAGIAVEKYIGKNNDIIVHAAQCGKDSPEGSRSQASVINVLEKHDIPASESTNIVKKVYERDIPIQSTVTLVHKVQNLLALHYPDLKLNEITKRIEMDNRTMDDVFRNTIVTDLKCKDKLINSTVVDEVLGSDFIPVFNPLKDFFNKYKDEPYDKDFGLIQELIDCILSDLGTFECDDGIDVDVDLKGDLMKKWLCGIIHSLYIHHSPLTLILTGDQNTGKTEFFRRLFPKEFQTYYAETKLHGGKDDDILLCEKLIVMDDECSGKTFKEMRDFKTLTSRDTFTIRRPYGRYHDIKRRLAVLCATTNDEAVISDKTGNRRIFPINIISIDYNRFNQINKTKLMLEVYHLWKSGYKWQLSKSDIVRLNKYTDRHVAADTAIESVARYFDPNTNKDSFHAEHMTATEIKDYIENKSEQKIKNIRELGLALKEMKYMTAYHKGSRGHKLRGYWMVKRLCC